MSPIIIKDNTVEENGQLAGRDIINGDVTNYRFFSLFGFKTPKEEEKQSWQKDVRNVSFAVLCLLAIVDIIPIYTLASSTYNPEAFFVVAAFSVTIAVDMIAVTVGKNNTKTIMAALLLSAATIWIAGVFEHGIIFVLSLAASIGIGAFALFMSNMDRIRSKLLNA